MRWFWMTMVAAGFTGLVACGGGTEAVAADDDGSDATIDDATDAVADAPADAPAEVPAFTGETQTVKTPVKEVQAQKHVNPAADTPEAAIKASLEMIAAGDFDGWIAQWCHDSYCGEDKSKESLKTYNLPATQKTAAGCLHEDGTTVLVTKHDPPGDDGAHRIYIWCGPDRMPPPASLVHETDGWKFTSFSW